MANKWEPVEAENDGWEPVDAAASAPAGWEPVDAPKAKAPVSEGLPSIEGNSFPTGTQHRMTDEESTIDAAKEAWTDAVGDRIGFDTENQDTMKKLTGGLYSGVNAAASLGDVLMGAGNAGLATLTHGFLSELGVAPEDAHQAAAGTTELANVGGLMFGEGGHPAAPAREAFRLTPELESAYLNVAKTGSADDIIRFTRENNIPIDEAEVPAFIQNREAGGKVSGVQYADRGPELTGSEAASLEDSLKAEADAFKQKKAEAPLDPEVQEFLNRKKTEEPTLEDVFPTDEQRALKEQAMADRLQAEADAFKRDKQPEAVPEPEPEIVPVEAKPELPEKVEVETQADLPEAHDVQKSIDSVTSGWKNAPEFEVHDTFDKIDNVDSDALGAYDPETRKILLNSKAIAEEAADRGLTPHEMTQTVIFHEGLGHYGLNQKFRSGLDGVLNSFVRGSGDFSKKVEAWMEKNPEAYVDDLNPKARAAEEILAEMSESGKIPVMMLNRVKNYVKSTARKMGLTVDYSIREIKSILAEAHDQITNGTPVETDGSLRYMMRRSGTSKGMAQGSFHDETLAPTTVANYRSKNNLKDVFEETAPKKEKETWDEWIDKAGKTRMTGEMAMNLSKGIEVPELKRAERFAVESANRVKELSAKVSKGLATERDEYLLAAEYQRLQGVSEAIQGVVSNSARILNSRKIEVASDKALADGLRRMASKGFDLKDPKQLAEAVAVLEKGDKKAKAMAKAMNVAANILNLPRSIMSSMDLSAPLRQGIFLTGSKEFWKNVPTMFKQFGSETAFRAVQDEIKSRPTYPLMERNRLALTDMGDHLTNREEAFVSKWAEKIPVAGRAIKASERAYTGFLNKLRADTFDRLINEYKKAGVDLLGDPKVLNDVTRFINSATGRGNIGKFEQASPILSSVFFSPRLIKSRLDLLNPVFYATLDPIVRKEAIKSLLSFGAITTTVASLAAAGGAKVETDPRSSDFAKIRVGNTRYDIMGGFGQYLTLGARLAKNETKNARGEVKELGKKYGSDTRLDVALKFGINKESPLASFVTDYLRGKNAIGEPFDAKQKAIESMIPLFLQDAAEVVKENGAVGIPMSVPGLFGVGMQTYDIPLGHDAFGRDIKELQEKGEDTDPVALDVARLNETQESPVLPAAPKTLTVDKEKIKLTPEQTDEFQKIMGEYTHKNLSEIIKLPAYQGASDEDKIELIKEVHSEAFAVAKETVLTGLSKGSVNVK